MRKTAASWRVGVFLLLSCLLVASTGAQPVPDVKNPSAVEIGPSPDHATIDSYELDILRPDGTVLQTLNLGKPTPVNGVITAPVNVQPAAFGVGYSLRVRVKAGTATSDYVVSSNKFDRVPGAPSKLVAK